MRQGILEGRLDVAYNDPFIAKKLASGFEYLPLKTLISAFSGGTPDTRIPEYWDGDIPWVSPKDFTDFYLNDTEDHISQAGQAASSLKIAPEGTTLVVVRSGILKHTLPIGITTQPMTINQDIKALIPTHEGLESSFLAHYLMVAGNRLLPVITKHSTTVQSINTSEFDKLLIPLPPLDIQRQLVAEMEAARAARKAKLAEAEALLAQRHPAK